MTNVANPNLQNGPRISIVCRRASTPDRDWNLSQNAPARVIITEEIGVLAYAVATCCDELGLDVERVIVDRAICADGFLQLLTELPDEYRGDVLYIHENGTGFLSAAARVTGRMLYCLDATDVRFYLETARVVTGMTVFQPATANAAA